MTPVIISSTGTIDPSQFINFSTVKQKDGTEEVLGITAKGLVYRLLGANTISVQNCLNWAQVSSSPWTR